MAKATVGKYVIIVAKCDASGKHKWLFVKNNATKKWELPTAKIGRLDQHPIISAVKSSIAIFGDLTNIELSFELDGDDVTAKVYDVQFDFEQKFKKVESEWHDPIGVLASSKVNKSKIDEFTESIMEIIIGTYAKMQGKKATKSNPLKFDL